MFSEGRQSNSLQESAHRMQVAIEAAGVVAWEFDVITRRLEYVGKMSALANAELEQAFRNELLEHAKGGAGRYCKDFRLVQPDGSVIWIRNQGQTIRDAAGYPRRVAGVALDITERKQAEELVSTILAGVSLSTGESFCRSLTEQLCAALKTDYACIGELDPMNPQMVQVVSIHGREKFWQEFEHPLTSTPSAEVLRSGRCNYPDDVQAAFPLDRTLSEMGIRSYVGVPLKGLSGEPLGIICVMHRAPLANAERAEILLSVFASRAGAELERRRWETSKKRAEMDLEESRRFAQRVAETSLNVLFVYDLVERRSVYANQRSADIIGYTPEEIEEMGGNFIEKLMHPDDLAQLPSLAKEYAVRKDGDVFENVFRIRHKNGDWRWVLRRATIFTRTPDGRPKQLLGSVTDITEYKNTEQELQQLSARLLNVQDEERRRIARELHDVTGQNLALINFNLSVLEQTASQTEVKHMLAECRRLCRESHEEVRTLSYLLHPPLLDELGLVRALNWYIDGFVRRAQIEVRFDVTSEICRLPLEMETDLFRVVQEALTNIRRHSGSHKARISLEIRNTQLILQIEDQGTGLTEELVEEKSNFEIGPGVGILGMRERLRQHKGSLEIRSDNSGTTLIAVIPLPKPTDTREKSADIG